MLSYRANTLVLFYLLIAETVFCIVVRYMKFTSRENCSLYSPHDTIHLSISKSCNLYSGSTIIVVLIQWLVRLQTKLGSYQKRDLSINTASAINSSHHTAAALSLNMETYIYIYIAYIISGILWKSIIVIVSYLNL